MVKPLIVGVSGGSGSGKTTFIKKLRTVFEETAVCILSQDDYYRPIQEQQKDKQGIENFDLPGSIDDDAFVKDIGRLAKGEIIQKPVYTFNNLDAELELQSFCPAPILVVEGIFVFHFPSIRELIDLKVYIHAKENLKIIRRIKRDREERNYPLEDVLYRFENHVTPAYEQYIRPYFELSDIVINNNDNFDMGFKVVEGYFRNYLAEIGYSIGR